MSESRQTQILEKVYNETAGGLDVNLQDQTSTIFMTEFNQKKGDTTLTVETAVEDTSITVADATGIVVGDTIVMSNAQFKVYVGEVIDISGAPVLEIDTPINAVYPSATTVNFGISNLAVDGSVTPQIFSFKNIGGDIPVSLDITRLIITMVTENPVDLTTFGDIANGLTKGIVLRKNNGEIIHYFNIKANAGFANIAYDYTPYSATNPQQGTDGLVCRLTFAGQNKIGAVIRVEPDEDLELLVQDKLDTITDFRIVAEGHVVI